MELQASRNGARLTARGEPILLLVQQRHRWNQVLIRRGLAALAVAEALSLPRGSYRLQAAIAASHARARTAADTDWPAIVQHYDALLQLTSSPVVAQPRGGGVDGAGTSGGIAPCRRIDLVGKFPHPPPQELRVGDKPQAGFSSTLNCARCRRCAPITCCRACAVICC